MCNLVCLYKAIHCKNCVVNTNAEFRANDLQSWCCGVEAGNGSNFLREQLSYFYPTITIGWEPDTHGTDTGKYGTAVKHDIINYD